MLKAFLNRAIRTVLDELFVDLEHDSGKNFTFNLNLLSGSTSNLLLQDQLLRPDIFDVLLQPLTLLHGHVSKISVSGLAELASSSRGVADVTMEVEEVALLFRVDSCCSAERAQFLKKSLLELQSGRSLPQALVAEVMKKLLGNNSSPSSSSSASTSEQKTRKLFRRYFVMLFDNLRVSVKNVHIRLETTGGSIGLMLSSASLTRGREEHRPDSASPEAKLLCATLKALQVYADYTHGVESSSPSYSKNPRRSFAAKATHVALLLPLDVAAVVAAELNRPGSSVLPCFSVNCARLKLAVDSRQLEVLRTIALQLDAHAKRAFHVLRLSLPVHRSPPRPVHSFKLHVLPYLLLRADRTGERASEHWLQAGTFVYHAHLAYALFTPP